MKSQVIIQEEDLLSRRSKWTSWLHQHYNFGRIPVDPFLQIFSDDPEILELNVDPNYYFRRDCEEALCVFPCFGPLVCLFLAHAYVVTKHIQNELESIAKAKHLILRESSLVFIVDASKPHDFDYSCCGLSTLVLPRARELVFSLDDPIELVKSKPRCKFYHTLWFISILYNGVSIASIYAAEEAIDSFIEKFNIQVGFAKEKLSSRNIDGSIRDIHRTILDIEQLLVEKAFPGIGGKEYDLVVRAYLSLARRAVPEMDPVDLLFDNSVSQVPPVAEIVRDIEPAIAVSLTRDSLIDYTANDVLELLRSLELSHLCSAFEKAKVDGGLLMIADEGTLIEIGMTSNIERKQILAWVMKQQRQNQPEPLS